MNRLVAVQLVRHDHPWMPAINGWSPANFPTGSRRSQPRLGSLLNQPSFKLSQSREDVEDQFARCGGSVNHPVRYGSKTDTTFLQVFDQVHKMSHGTPQAIQSPDNKRVAPPELLITRLQSWAVLTAAGELVEVQVILGYAIRE